MEKPRS